MEMENDNNTNIPCQISGMEIITLLLLTLPGDSRSTLVSKINLRAGDLITIHAMDMLHTLLDASNIVQSEILGIVGGVAEVAGEAGDGASWDRLLRCDNGKESNWRTVELNGDDLRSAILKVNQNAELDGNETTFVLAQMYIREVNETGKQLLKMTVRQLKDWIQNFWGRPLHREQDDACVTREVLLRLIAEHFCEKTGGSLLLMDGLHRVVAMCWGFGDADHQVVQSPIIAEVESIASSPIGV